MRIIYRDGWSETFLNCTRILYRPNCTRQALICRSDGTVVTWIEAAAIREVYAL